MSQISECLDHVTALASRGQTAATRPFLAGRTVDVERPEPPNAFERLVQIMRHNDRLDAELRALTTRLDHTRSYLIEPGSSHVLGKANLWSLKAKYAANLTLLRANRIEAQHLMGMGRPFAVANTVAVVL